jgi:hypothetical protein
MLMRMFLATLIAVACGNIAAPALAREKCTSMCHFFNAWAITQVCKNLTFNDAGRQEDKDYGDFRGLKRRALAIVKKWPNACHPNCKWDGDAGDDSDDTCMYLQPAKSDVGVGGRANILNPEELEMARECHRGKPCSLTCNRAHDAGRDDLIRAGAPRAPQK